MPLALHPAVSEMTGVANAPTCMKKAPPPKLAALPVKAPPAAESALPALSATAPPRAAVLPVADTLVNAATAWAPAAVPDCSSSAPPLSSATLAENVESEAVTVRLPYANSAPPDTALLPRSAAPPETRTAAAAVAVAVTHTAPPRPAPKVAVADSPGSSAVVSRDTELPTSAAPSNASAGAEKGFR